MKKIVPRARAFVPAPRTVRPEHAPNYRYSHHIPEDADFDDLRFAGEVGRVDEQGCQAGGIVGAAV